MRTFPTQRHQATHRNLRPFPCQECGVRFRQKVHLKAHMRAIHIRLKPFSCHVCGQNFAARSSLKRHVTYVHIRSRPSKRENSGRNSLQARDRDADRTAQGAGPSSTAAIAHTRDAAHAGPSSRTWPTAEGLQVAAPLSVSTAPPPHLVLQLEQRHPPVPSPQQHIAPSYAPVGSRLPQATPPPPSPPPSSPPQPSPQPLPQPSLPQPSLPQPSLSQPALSQPALSQPPSLQSSPPQQGAPLLPRQSSWPHLTGHGTGVNLGHPQRDLSRQGDAHDELPRHRPGTSNPPHQAQSYRFQPQSHPEFVHDAQARGRQAHYGQGHGDQAREHPSVLGQTHLGERPPVQPPRGPSFVLQAHLGEPDRGPTQRGQNSGTLLLHDQPTHDQPVRSQPAHDEAARGQPAHDQPVRGQPAHGHHIHAQPIQPRPVHREPIFAQHTHDQQALQDQLNDESAYQGQENQRVQDITYDRGGTRVAEATFSSIRASTPEAPSRARGFGDSRRPP